MDAIKPADRPVFFSRNDGIEIPHNPRDYTDHPGLELRIGHPAQLITDDKSTAVAETLHIASLDVSERGIEVMLA